MDLRREQRKQAGRGIRTPRRCAFRVMTKRGAYYNEPCGPAHRLLHSLLTSGIIRQSSLVPTRDTSVVFRIYRAHITAVLAVA